MWLLVRHGDILIKIRQIIRSNIRDGAWVILMVEH